MTDWRSVVAEVAHVLATPLPTLMEMDWCDVIAWHAEAARIAKARGL